LSSAYSLRGAVRDNLLAIASWWTSLWWHTSHFEKVSWGRAWRRVRVRVSVRCDRGESPLREEGRSDETSNEESFDDHRGLLQYCQSGTPLQSLTCFCFTSPRMIRGLLQDLFENHHGVLAYCHADQLSAGTPKRRGPHRQDKSRGVQPERPQCAITERRSAAICESSSCQPLLSLRRMSLARLGQ
jgi:hypothetical protein